MPIVKRIVLLANSRKLSGRCLAGKERIREENRWSWIRPISDRPSEELSEDERQCQDGSDPRVLDVIDVPLREARPKAYQAENWLIEPDFYWVRVGTATWNNLAVLADEPPTLWSNGSHTFHGDNDRVAESEAATFDRSLYLIHLDAVKLHVFAPGAAFNNPKRRVQAAFSTKGVDYRVWVTDPLIERIYRAGQDGEFEIGECFATISLGEPNKDGFCYKLVAALIIRAEVDK